MNLDNQVKLIKHIISLPKSETRVELTNLTGYRLLYQYHFESTVINLVADNSYDTIMAIDWDEDTNIIRYQFSNNGIIEIDNITSILQDYEELDINQFILTYTRDPFKWNGFDTPILILKILQSNPIN